MPCAVSELGRDVVVGSEVKASGSYSSKIRFLQQQTEVLQVLCSW